MPRKRLARVVESGWVLRRKADGYISAYGGEDARTTGERPAFHTTATLGAGMPASHWEMVHVTRTVTIEETEPHD